MYCRQTCTAGVYWSEENSLGTSASEFLFLHYIFKLASGRTTFKRTCLLLRKFCRIDNAKNKGHLAISMNSAPIQAYRVEEQRIILKQISGYKSWGYSTSTPDKECWLHGYNICTGPQSSLSFPLGFTLGHANKLHVYLAGSHLVCA